MDKSNNGRLPLELKIVNKTKITMPKNKPNLN